MTSTEKVSKWQRFEHQAIRAFQHLAARRRTSVLVCAILGFGLPALFGAIQGFAEPTVHDEFSHLLAADTFAHGRLTNPTPDMWQHFESPHILLQPSYMSKYPPGQGMVMGLGQALFGHPAFGVWLSVGLAAGSLCWMLQAWTRARWALLATLLFIVALGVTHNWSQRYWGGMLAVAGGALLFGGLRRILHRPSVASSLAMACGTLMLANTRPYEGAIVALACFVVFVVWFVKDRRLNWQRKILRTIAPIAAVLLIGGGWMLYYNYRVTGSAFTMPYRVHHRQYFRAPLFVFQSENEPTAEGHPRLKRFHDQFRAKQFGKSYFFTEPRDLMTLHLQSFLGLALAAPIVIAFPWLVRDRWLLLVMGIWLFLALMMSLATFSRISHYAAPIVGVTFLLLAASLRRLRLMRTGSVPLPRLKCRYLLLLLLCLWIVGEGPRIARASYYALRGDARQLSDFTRTDVIQEVSKEDGPHLIIVQYAPDYSLHHEWVYNGADINGQNIVWAHDLGEEQNQKLPGSFPNRKAWLLKVTNSGSDLERR